MLPLGGTGGGTLQLTRAVDGRRDLMDWLRPPRAVAPRGGAAEAIAAASGRPPRRLPKLLPRSVTITVFDAAGREVTRYRFAEVEPVSLALSPMDAQADAVLTETLTLSFRSMTMEP